MKCFPGSLFILCSSANLKQPLPTMMKLMVHIYPKTIQAVSSHLPCIVVKLVFEKLCVHSGDFCLFDCFCF